MGLMVPKYSYLDARVTVFSRRLLSTPELDGLIDGPAGESEDLLARVRLPASHDRLEALAPLQSVFMARLLEEATIIVRPLKGPARRLIRYWIRRFSHINLKTLVRGKKAGWPADAIRGELVNIGPFESLPMEDLVHAEDLRELLARLERLEDGAVVRRARDRFEETGDPFWIEAVLDRQYFDGLTRRVQELDAVDRESVRPLTGRLLDEISLVWLLRYRFGYGLTPAHTYFLLPMGGRHLSREVLSRLVQSDSLGALLEQVPQPLGEELAEARTTAEVEDRLREGRLRAAEGILRWTRFNLGRALAYLMLRESQLASIHAAVRGRSLELPTELIRAAARGGRQGRGEPDR